MMRILALDVGEKNIGLAISDKLGYTAQGLPNLRRQAQDEDIFKIIEIAKANEVTEIVVGMPLNLDGSLGSKAKEVTQFLEQLQNKVDLPVKTWDERLTTVQAEKVLLAQDTSRKKRKIKIDRLAAQLILQGYLDAKSESKDVRKDSPQ